MPASLSVRTDQIADGFRRLVRPWLSWGVAIAIVLCLLQAHDSLSQALTLGVLLAPVLVGAAIWCHRGGPCLPVLPLLLTTNLILYGLPLVQFNSSDLPDPLVDLVGPSLFLWPTMLLVGWFLVPAAWLRRPPLPSLIGLGAAQPVLPHLLLAAALLLSWLLQANWLWDAIGPAFLGPLRNPINTVIILLTLPGGFIGAYRFARRQLHEPVLFWMIAVAYFFSYILSFLLSAAQNLVLSILLGIWIGRARQALLITLSLVLLLAFLHPGKAAMREKYWGTGVPMPSPPEVVAEWISESIIEFSAPPSSNANNEDLGKRVQNLGMLLFANVQLQRGVPPLWGQTYALIPELLIPRFLSPEKARSQEGQVVLNLHFGRQRTRADTEKTYIAWGMLPEAVGNFGPVWGPVLVGLVFGALIRCSELLGAGQDLLSKAGLQSLVTGVIIIGSFELVSTTLAAALAQIIILIELVSLLFQVRQ